MDYLGDRSNKPCRKRVIFKEEKPSPEQSCGHSRTRYSESTTSISDEHTESDFSSGIFSDPNIATNAGGEEDRHDGNEDGAEDVGDIYIITKPTSKMATARITTIVQRTGPGLVLAAREVEPGGSESRSRTSGGTDEKDIFFDAVLPDDSAVSQQVVEGNDDRTGDNKDVNAREITVGNHSHQRRRTQISPDLLPPPGPTKLAETRHAHRPSSPQIMKDSNPRDTPVEKNFCLAQDAVFLMGRNAWIRRQRLSSPKTNVLCVTRHTSPTRVAARKTDQPNEGCLRNTALEALMSARPKEKGGAKKETKMAVQVQPMAAPFPVDVGGTKTSHQDAATQTGSSGAFCFEKFSQWEDPPDQTTPTQDRHSQTDPVRYKITETEVERLNFTFSLNRKDSVCVQSQTTPDAGKLRTETQCVETTTQDYKVITAKQRLGVRMSNVVEIRQANKQKSFLSRESSSPTLKRHQRKSSNLCRTTTDMISEHCAILRAASHARADKIKMPAESSFDKPCALLGGKPSIRTRNPAVNAEAVVSLPSQAPCDRPKVNATEGCKRVRPVARTGHSKMARYHLNSSGERYSSSHDCSAAPPAPLSSRVHDLEDDGQGQPRLGLCGDESRNKVVRAAARPESRPMMFKRANSVRNTKRDATTTTSATTGCSNNTTNTATTTTPIARQATFPPNTIEAGAGGGGGGGGRRLPKSGTRTDSGKVVVVVLGKSSKMATTAGTMTDGKLKLGGTLGPGCLSNPPEEHNNVLKPEADRTASRASGYSRIHAEQKQTKNTTGQFPSFANENTNAWGD